LSILGEYNATCSLTQLKDKYMEIEMLMQEVLFEEYRISSQNDDRIAFTVDLALLLRALKSSVSMDGEKLQVKLVKKRPIATERPMPYLTFESKVLFKQRT